MTAQRDERCLPRAAGERLGERARAFEGLGWRDVESPDRLRSSWATLCVLLGPKRETFSPRTLRSPGRARMSPTTHALAVSRNRCGRREPTRHARRSSPRGRASGARVVQPSPPRRSCPRSSSRCRPLYWVVDATRRASLVVARVATRASSSTSRGRCSKGDLDYRDVRDVNGPLTHLVHIVFLKLGRRRRARVPRPRFARDRRRVRVRGRVPPGRRTPREASPRRLVRARIVREIASRGGWALAAWVVLSGQYLALHLLGLGAAGELLRLVLARVDRAPARRPKIACAPTPTPRPKAKLATPAVGTACLALGGRVLAAPLVRQAHVRALHGRSDRDLARSTTCRCRGKSASRGSLRGRRSAPRRQLLLPRRLRRRDRVLPHLPRRRAQRCTSSSGRDRATRSSVSTASPRLAAAAALTSAVMLALLAMGSLPRRALARSRSCPLVWPRAASSRSERGFRTTFTR